MRVTDLTKLLVLRVLWSAILLQSVMVPFFLWKGLNFSQVLLIQSIFSILLFALELPTGFISDLVGRRKMLIIAAICRGGAGVGFLILDGFWGMVGAYILVSLSITIFSGTDIASVYENLKTKDAEDAKRLETISAFFWMPLAISAILAVLGGSLFELSKLLATWMNLIITLVTIPVALSLTRIPEEKIQWSEVKHRRTNILTDLRKSFTVPYLRYAIMSSALFLLPFTATLYAFQKIWVTSGYSPTSMGLIFGLAGLVSSFSAFVFPRLVNNLGIKGIYIGAASITSLALLAPLSGLPALAIVSMVLVQFVMGSTNVLHVKIINDGASDLSRGSINSLVSFVSKSLASLTMLAASALTQSGDQTVVFTLTFVIFVGGISVVLPQLLRTPNLQRP